MESHFEIVDDAIGIITMDHGKVNSLSKSLLDEITSTLQSIQDPSSPIRVVIIRAKKGAKIFSAGHDVHELPLNGRDPLTYNDPLRQVVREIEHCRQPIIAMVEGTVWGGACELVMGCDIVIAAKDSTFAATPGKIGVPYNIHGSLNFLKVTDVHLLKEMLFTAEPISATRMEACGIVNHVVEREELETLAMDLAHKIARNSPLVLRVLKEQIRVLTNAHPLIPETYERIQALRREAYDSDDYHEGIEAFLQKRAPVFKGY